MVPDGFKGIVCVGLFSTPIPQSKPLACTIAAPNGDYHMQDASSGQIYSCLLLEWNSQFRLATVSAMTRFCAPADRPSVSPKMMSLAIRI